MSRCVETFDWYCMYKKSNVWSQLQILNIQFIVFCSPFSWSSLGSLFFLYSLPLPFNLILLLEQKFPSCWFQYHQSISWSAASIRKTPLCHPRGQINLRPRSQCLSCLSDLYVLHISLSSSLTHTCGSLKRSPLTPSLLACLKVTKRSFFLCVCLVLF